MMRFVKVRARQQLVLLCCIAVLTAVARSELPATFRNPADVLRVSKCAYRNIQYGAGDFVKTGEPCLNCTCSNGAIVCHLRVCSPIPNPPPPGCFILHKKDMCCPELVCNDDNNILYDGLEARSRPGSNEDTELDLENFTKRNRNRGCVINGTTYAEGSALSSSTDCNYCFCLKGREQCVRPNCVLQLAGCTPIFNKHACCPVKYNCHGSDNVTIISTELSLGHATTTRITTSGSNQELLGLDNQSQANSQDVQLNSFATEKIKSTDIITEINTIQDQRQTYMESSSLPFDNERKYTHNTPTNAEKISDEPVESTSQVNPPFSSVDAGPVRSTDENLGTETITEISTSISLIKTELVLQEVADAENQSSFVEERRNTFSDAETPNSGDSTQAYDRSSKANFTSKAESTATMKTIPPEIEAILNITKKKQEGDYELDYDEPTLPPSLPNLKIIPFVAADALDKPKDAVIEHREDTSLAVEVTDSILESPVLQAGQFSPPVKTEGGFVPRDPTLDGPYFESKYNSIYHTTDNTEINASEQLILPSITEPSKVVDNALCTNGYLTYRHGELISEPKACNMCLCLYGEIVCQKPECPAVKPGCKRINYEDVSNCCGEIVCDDDITTSSTSSTESEKFVDIITVPSEPMVVNVTQDYAVKENSSESIIQTEIATPTLPPSNPTYMIFKVKGKNHSKTEHTSTGSVESKTTEFTTPLRLDSTSQSALTPSDKPTSTEKMDADYDNGFSLENMLSFLFDEPPVLKSKNVSTETPKTAVPTSQAPTTVTSAVPASSTTTIRPDSVVELLTSKATTELISESRQNTTEGLTSAKPMKSETDSAIYMIKNENQYSKNIVNYTDDQTNTIKQVNSYYVPPLGNFEEVILNPTKKPFGSSKKPLKANPYFSTTYRPRHTTAKVIPLSRPSEKNTPQVIAGDPGAASGLLKLSGCNIFGKMYRIGKIIAELSGPCLQCMCAEVGVHCLPLKC